MVGQILYSRLMNANWYDIRTIVLNSHRQRAVSLSTSARLTLTWIIFMHSADCLKKTRLSSSKVPAGTDHSRGLNSYIVVAKDITYIEYSKWTSIDPTWPLSPQLGRDPGMDVYHLLATRFPVLRRSYNPGINREYNPGYRCTFWDPCTTVIRNPFAGICTFSGCVNIHLF